MDTKATTIYGLIDPLTSELRYIGKTSMPVRLRYNQHVCVGPTAGRTHCRKWIAKLLEAGYRPELEILEIVPSENDWEEAERFWISYWKYIGAKLTNLTDGGSHDYIGKPHTSGENEKSAVKRRGVKRTPEQIERMKAGWTPEGKLRMAEAARQRGFFKNGGWKLSPRTQKQNKLTKPKATCDWSDVGGRIKLPQEKVQISAGLRAYWANKKLGLCATSS